MSNELIFRGLTFAVLATALTITGYFRRRADRRGGALRSAEGQGLLIVLRLLGLATVLPVLIYLVNPDWVAWARFPVPEWMRWAAAVVAVALVPVFYWILASLGDNISPVQATRQNHQLVTHGPYRYVRHPLYSAGCLFVIALVVLTGLWWLAASALVPLTLLLLRTSKEEARLIEAFGDEYRAYMRRTGRFLPKFR